MLLLAGWRWYLLEIDGKDRDGDNNNEISYQCCWAERSEKSERWGILWRDNKGEDK
mgnify:CR=1 FL=1